MSLYRFWQQAIHASARPSASDDVVAVSLSRPAHLAGRSTWPTGPSRCLPVSCSKTAAAVDDVVPFGSASLAIARRAYAKQRLASVGIGVIRRSTMPSRVVREDFLGLLPLAPQAPCRRAWDAVIVGHEGRVTAVELDPMLAAVADSLADRPNVDVVQGDGFTAACAPGGYVDVSFSVERPAAPWIGSLRPGPR